MGKTGFVDQKVAARFGRVRELVLAERGRFALQGSVVAAWRLYAGRRLGPYFRLAYRDGGRQRSIYLGRCVELARRVRELLAGLQRPRRERLLFARLKAQVRASLRSAKAERTHRPERLGEPAFSPLVSRKRVVREPPRKRALPEHSSEG